MEVDYVLHNKVKESDFERVVQEWLSQGDYTPDDIIENIITEKDILLAPLYFYKNDWYGNCSASIGYQKQRYYTDYDFNGKPQRKTQYYTEWVPHSQRVQGHTEATVYAGENLNEDIVKFIEDMPWRAEDLFRFSNDSEHYNQIASLFHYSKTTVWNEVGYKRMQNEVYIKSQQQLPSMYVRDVHVNFEYNTTTAAAIVAPYWLYVYEYKEKTYYVIVDGNTPNRVGGVRPENETRKNIVIAIRWTEWLLALFATYKFTKSCDDILKDLWSLGIWAFFVLMIVCLIVGIGERIISNIKNSSQKKRDVVLQNKQNKTLKN